VLKLKKKNPAPKGCMCVLSTDGSDTPDSASLLEI
jgi:hypothetical protein